VGNPLQEPDHYAAAPTDCRSLARTSGSMAWA
jgi:hypothetical protein